VKKGIIIAVFMFIGLGCLYAEEDNLSFEEKHRDKSLLLLESNRTIKVNEDWSYRTVDYEKIKILKEDAKSLGEMPNSYEKGRQKITLVSAYTITPDGKRHKYTRVQDINEYPSYPVYSDAMTRIITFPEVNVGSIVAYKVVIDSKYKPIKNAFWEEIFLQSNLPVKSFKVKVILPKKLNIQYKEFNLEHKPNITQDSENIIYSWEMDDVYYDSDNEAYFSPPSVDNITDTAEFSSIQNWSDISDWYYSLVQNNLKITPEIKQAAEKAIESKINIKDKVRAILEYVQDNFRYVSMSFGQYSLEPHPTDQVFKNKYGDCKDLSLLCMAMLKVADIKSDIALFEDEFSISDPKFDLPMPLLFDHTLLLVRDEKEGDFYIDPLLKGYDIGEYPLYYQNAYTFIITAKGGEFKNLPIFQEQRVYAKKERDTVINPDGSALTEVKSSWDLDYSIEKREMLESMDNTQKEEFFQRLDATLANGGEIIERRLDNQDKRYGRITSYVKIRERDAYLVSDGLIILEFLGYARDIEFTKETRENPIFFPRNSCAETVETYHIPKGFSVLSLPEDIEKDVGFFNVKRAYKKEKDKITMHEIERQKRIELPKEDHAKVKEFFDKLPGDTYQRIVLKRKISHGRK